MSLSPQEPPDLTPFGSAWQSPEGDPVATVLRRSGTICRRVYPLPVGELLIGRDPFLPAFLGNDLRHACPRQSDDYLARASTGMAFASA
jgi:hypothetical protein